MFLTSYIAFSLYIVEGNHSLLTVRSPGLVPVGVLEGQRSKVMRKMRKESDMDNSKSQWRRKRGSEGMREGGMEE